MNGNPTRLLNDTRKRIVFLTGTRADFGKIKSLIKAVHDSPEVFDVHIFATGMHMEPKYGYTVEEITKCGFQNVYRFINQSSQGVMDRSLAHTLLGFGDYVRLLEPDLIVVHGDRPEALAGAMVGALNNVRVAHVEGGELSGTVDELIRHSVSKLSHLHFVSNEGAKQRLMQLGEQPETVHVIGSADIDIMCSPDLPSLRSVKEHYEIPFEDYGVVVFHPVTTELQHLVQEANEIADAVLASGRQVVVVYPNSDHGSDWILEVFRNRFTGDPKVKMFPSLRFESMLVLLKHADFILGNSSMGIHEAPFYGVPTINVGSRQQGRSRNPHILNVPAERGALLGALSAVDGVRPQLVPSQEFGSGDSDLRFRTVLESGGVWDVRVQKQFRDLDVPSLVPPVMPDPTDFGPERADGTLDSYGDAPELGLPKVQPSVPPSASNG